jgi:hypothetical protein
MAPIGTVLPLRLGFVLERTGVPFPYRPEICYRGVDRLPFDPTPEEEEELQRSGKSRLVSLYHRYGDTLFTGELHRDQHLAMTLQREFAEEGSEFEVIYAAVVSAPSHPDSMVANEGSLATWNRLRHHHEAAPRCPTRALLLGYDVSYPLPSFHSVLLQPGLRDQPDGPLLNVNGAGLLANAEELEEIMTAANAMHSSWRPFCGIAVYSIR